MQTVKPMPNIVLAKIIDILTETTFGPTLELFRIEIHCQYAQVIFKI